MAKRKVYLDMDGVISDFLGAKQLVGCERRDYGMYPEMYEVGFFENLPPVKGSLWAVRSIALYHDVWILTQPVKDSAHSYSEKATWVMKWFPELAHKIIMTQDKGIIARPGDVLVDDNHEKWRAPWEAAGGIFFTFCEKTCPLKNWDALRYMLADLEDK